MDLIDFITKRVQDAIEKSEFKRMGEKFSRISISRAIAQIGREDENKAAARPQESTNGGFQERLCLLV
ncbi:MAG: hypothetical protein WA869_02865 [Alloacidobacterium sp.]|jgi:hypothetical protein